jgi:Arc/MetJ-type ribon-helix-helix transcriptional regulator
MSEKTKYVTVSIPRGIANDIDRLIQELGYWPSKSSFVREACLEKIWSERRKIRELINREDTKDSPKHGGQAAEGEARL